MAATADLFPDAAPPQQPTQRDTAGSTGGVFQFDPNFSDAEILEFNDGLVDNDNLDSFIDTLSDAERRAYDQRVVALQNARSGNLSGGQTEMESLAGAFAGGLGLGVGGVISAHPEGAKVAAEVVAGAVFEPIDWLLTAKEIYNDPKNPLSYAGLIPFVPASVGKLGKGVLKAADKGGEFGKAVTRTAKAVGEVATKLPLNARSLTGKSGVQEIYRRLEKFHGIPKHLASERLHDIKKALGYAPDADLLFDLTGNVYDPITRDWIGSLTEGGSRGLLP